MGEAAPVWTLGHIAAFVGGDLEGPADFVVSRPVLLTSSEPQGIAFVESADFADKLKATPIGAVIAPPGLDVHPKHAIRVPKPRFAFARLLAAFARPLSLEPGIHPSALIHPSAQIDPSACIGAYVVVDADAVIEKGAHLFPHVFVGARSRIGADSMIYPLVAIYHDVSIGARCLVHSGCVIGADGFGFVFDGSIHHKVPHAGGVQIGDDVELGSNTAIDRAMAGDTVIGDGTKLDNLVQVGHNVQIGSHTVVAGLTGFSGSAQVGSRVQIGGQVGIPPHKRVGDDVAIGAKSGVADDLLEPGEYFGTPARPASRAKRAFLLSAKLPEMLERIRALEREVAELTRRLDDD
ncbi:MAG: UDP-3-O-(3-hydroxymyristoyl)glucosamine N-acyltransferase [Fimbriimonadaceae bacterium]